MSRILKIMIAGYVLGAILFVFIDPWLSLSWICGGIAGWWTAKIHLYLTLGGMPQAGVVLVCQEHGVQSFDSIVTSHRSPVALVLGCGCRFQCEGDGSLTKVVQ